MPQASASRSSIGTGVKTWAGSKTVTFFSGEKKVTKEKPDSLAFFWLLFFHVKEK